MRLFHPNEQESEDNEIQVKMMKGSREKIESELAKICEDILDVLEEHLIPSVAPGESKAFYPFSDRTRY